MTMISKIAVVLIAYIAVASCSSAEQAQQPGGAPPPTPVSTAPVTEESVPIELRAVGSVEPFATVEVKSQVAGPLLSVRFTEGANVSKGDLLFEIDPRPYREALRQAEAAETKDLAQLRQAEANLARDRAQLKNAEAEAMRYEELTRQGILSRTQSEQLRTAATMGTETVRADEAAIESLRASIESDRAAIDRARLELSYCEIRSPINGRAGNLLLNSGNLVQANGDDPLVVINQISPIFVSFGIPEKELGKIAEKSRGRKLAVEASVEHETGATHSGTLSVIDNAVDPGTGTIRLKAVFQNSDRALWPGQFVNVVLTLERQMAIVIPAEAVQAGQEGSFVYAVKPDQTVEARPVTVGVNVGGKVIIESGLAVGDTVVTDGQSRLYPGATIQAVSDGKTS